jgi:hypothetical protein
MRDLTFMTAILAHYAEMNLKEFFTPPPPTFVHSFVIYLSSPVVSKKSKNTRQPYYVFINS